MRQLRFNILRLMEGYWPSPLDWLTVQLARLQNWRISRDEKRLNALKTSQTPLTARQQRKMADLELRLHYFPVEAHEAQPTALGNILRSGETISKAKYGLDAFTCLPRLWLLLPELPRQDLSESRQSLMGYVELWAWGFLFLVWTWFSAWALLAGFLWMLIAYQLCLQTAMTYGDLLEAVFDNFRWELYKAVRWSLPDKSGEDEVHIGQQLTEFLWRGTTEFPVVYADSSNK